MPRITSSEHFRRHHFLRLVFEDDSLQILFGLFGMSRQLDLHEYYATDRDYGEEEFLEHRKQLDTSDPSMRHEVGKSFKELERAFILASRAHGITDEQRREIVNGHRRAPPAYASVSAAEEVAPVYSDAASSNVTIVPIFKRVNMKQYARAVLALVNWQLEHPDYVPKKSKYAAPLTAVPEPTPRAAPSSSAGRRRTAHRDSPAA